MSRWRNRLRWLGYIAGALAVLGVAAYLYLRSCVAEPPALPADVSITNLVAETRGGRVWLGKNWFERRDGLNVLYLTGSAFERGYANGKLTEKLVHQQEQVVVDLMNKAIPQRWAQWIIEATVVFQTRYLSRYVSPEIQMEILGMTYGCPDVRPQDGPYFDRVLSYHAAQDISYMLMNHPLVRGCTGFGAWGSETVGGHLLCGRNFDWEAAPVFDEDRVMILCEPDKGIPFASLAWAGMAGCVSGMNREGISITVNGAPSDLPAYARTPTCMVAREVLQYAHTLDEATAIIRRSEVFVSALFLVGSRRDGRFIIIEKTPTRTALQPGPAGDFIVQANHYLTTELKDIPINVKFMSVDTSVSRAARMDELLRARAGRLDAPAAAAILRDRELPGGVFAGNGHRTSLNPLIATHAVVMDLTDGIFWAACPPHQLGKFVAFDMNDFNRALPDKTIAADPFDYETYRRSQQALESGWAALKRHDAVAAAESARWAEELNPGYYKNSWLRGAALLERGDKEAARTALMEAEARRPALGRERHQIEELLRASQP
ncbi:MAG TPA: C45 family peptidase [Verrucomicrobiae bacterium]|nr:C45 family peptidase [Verrucomicrobiae bacterium]